MKNKLAGRDFGRDLFFFLDVFFQFFFSKLVLVYTLMSGANNEGCACACVFLSPYAHVMHHFCSKKLLKQGASIQPSPRNRL